MLPQWYAPQRDFHGCWHACNSPRTRRQRYLQTKQLGMLQAATTTTTITITITPNNHRP